MSRIVHLSDLHFGANDRMQPQIHEGLIKALEKTEVDLIVFTGDLFDSNRPDPTLLERFRSFYERLEASIGRGVPAILIPGNHDRRESGVFGPWSNALFQALRERFADLKHVRVIGTRRVRGEVVDVPGLTADIVTYDSTYVPRGYISAGGAIAQEDLIELASQLEGGSIERPILFLLHHHLVPTPITDTAAIDTKGRPFFQRFFVDKVLPNLVGHGNHEELTMTALGAGTALSTLHLLGRSVVVLHGHKHYATARLLKGLGDDSDVLITSAGSCGLAQDWMGGDYDESPRLWPSFNLIEVDKARVEVRSQAWSPADPNRRNTPRILASVRRFDRRWELEPVDDARGPFEPVIALNQAEFRLQPSTRFFDRFDVIAKRDVSALPAAFMTEYWDIVPGASGSRVVDIVCDGKKLPDAPCPARICVPMNGTTTYRIEGGVMAAHDENEMHHASATSFGSVGLLNRSRTTLARLRLLMGPLKARPFASVIDLTTGKQRPLPLVTTGDAVEISLENCAARMLLKISWPLEA